jgi:hypothetical protein
MLNRIKDTVIEKAVLGFLGPKLGRYGRLLSFRVDSEARVCRAEVQMHGDSTPLEIIQARYRLEPRDADTLLVLHDLKVSREWVQNLLEDHFPEIRIRVPDILKQVL